MTETSFELWTHVCELQRPTNTGRLASLCLPSARVRPAGGPRSLRPDLERSSDERTYLLFPSDDAELLTASFAHADPRPLRLVVPDGTWSQARRFARQLSHLPRLRLPDGAPTRFRLRGSVRSADRICTLEAVARVLGIVEGHLVEASLLEALDLMVDRTLFTRGQLDPRRVTGGIDGRAHARAMSRRR